MAKKATFSDQVVDLMVGLVSPDRPTRRMSMLFFASLAGAIAMGVVIFERNGHMEQARLAKQHLAKVADEDESPSGTGHELVMLDLGQFTIELKPVDGHPRKPGGFMNMAEVEMVIECDSKATHDYIEENLVQARSALTDVLFSMDRANLLTTEGKRELKKRLLDRINGWIPHGKVYNVFFSKLVVA